MIKRSSAVVLICALLVSAVAYLPALGGPFLLDDGPNLTDNPYLAFDPQVFDAWRIAALSSDASVLYRPVAMFTFAVNAAFDSDLSPLLVKATNLGLHLACAVILFFLCRTLLASPALRSRSYVSTHADHIALLAAVVWLLHPLHVSTVMYAVQRMAQLTTLFTLLGLLVLAHYRVRFFERGAGTGEVLAAGLWLIVFTLLATFSKENGALLPLLVAVVEITLFGGLWNNRRQRALLVLAWCALLLPVLALAAKFAVDPGWLDARYGRREFTLQERLLTQPRILWHYVSWFFVPDITRMGFHHDDIAKSLGWFAPATTLSAIVVWAGLLAIAVLRHRQFPVISFIVLFFLVAHALESSIWPLEMAFEHRNYLPSAVLSFGVALLFGLLLQRLGAGMGRVAVGLLLLALLVPLVMRTTVWGDELSLARHNVINHPASPRANFQYANVLYSATLNQGQHSGNALSADERRAYIVASRQHFLHMHELAPEDFAPVVMLHRVDARWFPTLPDRTDWLTELQALAKSRVLQSSDRTALASLVKYVAANGSKEDQQRVLDIVNTLLLRYPNSGSIGIHRYKLFTHSQLQDRDAALAVLVDLQERRPHDLRTYPYLVDYYSSDDLGSLFDTVGDWMAQDDLRRDVLFMRGLFHQ